MRQATPPLPAAIAAATIATASLALLLSPATILHLVAMTIIFGVVATWTYDIFNTPKIEDGHITNQTLFDYTLGSATGEITLKDLDGDGIVTLKDTIMQEELGDFHPSAGEVNRPTLQQQALESGLEGDAE
jgi:hypothetical protein